MNKTEIFCVYIKRIPYDEIVHQYLLTNTTYLLFIEISIILRTKFSTRKTFALFIKYFLSYATATPLHNALLWAKFRMQSGLLVEIKVFFWINSTSFYHNFFLKSLILLFALLYLFLLGHKMHFATNMNVPL